MGPPNPPIEPTEVAVYGGLPANFREIALVEAHVYFTALLSDEAKTSMAVDALARGAAGVGANGIMIRNLHPAAVNAFGHGHRAFRMGAVENNFAHMATYARGRDRDALRAEFTCRRLAEAMWRGEIC